MKAIVYNGPRDVAVKDMPDPTIQHPSDVIVRITTTNICGSDLHMYEGRTNLEPGKIIGHENLGEIVECGPCRAARRSICACRTPISSDELAQGPDGLRFRRVLDQGSADGHGANQRQEL
jgi:hypothetical protein